MECAGAVGIQRQLAPLASRRVGVGSRCDALAATHRVSQTLAPLLS